MYVQLGKPILKFFLSEKYFLIVLFQNHCITINKKVKFDKNSTLNIFMRAHPHKIGLSHSLVQCGSTLIVGMLNSPRPTGDLCHLTSFFERALFLKCNHLPYNLQNWIMTYNLNFQSYENLQPKIQSWGKYDKLCKKWLNSPGSPLLYAKNLQFSSNLV